MGLIGRDVFQLPQLHKYFSVSCKHIGHTLKMERKTQKDNRSGIVRVNDGHVSWEYKNESLLQIDLNQVCVIGEYTNTNGPYFDDYFLALVTKDGRWVSIPWYADNIDELTLYLSEKLHQDVNVSYLANSMEWKSFIHYPTYLKGQPLFTLTQTDNYKLPKTLFEKIIAAIGLGNFNSDHQIDLTNEVKEDLANACR
jgi:hypothetical protein